MEGHPFDLARRGAAATGALNRRVKAQGLLHVGRHQGRVVPEDLVEIGSEQQPLHEVGQQAPGGVDPGLDHEVELGHHLLVAQRLPLDHGIEQRGEDVIAPVGCGPASGELLGEEVLQGMATDADIG